MILLSWFGAKGIVASGNQAALGLTTGELASLITYAMQILMTLINHLWLLICACFVFFMQAGFVCYEVGFVQPKNVISVAMENITAFVVATLSFYTVGFALMFGKTLFGLVGTSYWLLSRLNSPYDFIFALYQMMLAATSITIFAGSMG